MADVFAGMTGIRAAIDIAKTLQGMSDASERLRISLELREKLGEALEAQSAQAKRIGDLEQQLMRFETWEAEKQRYELRDLGAHNFALSLKPERADGEPAHSICQPCYERREKMILNRVSTIGTDDYTCPGCKHRMNVPNDKKWPNPPRGNAATSWKAF